jgi:hypothetical protein
MMGSFALSMFGLEVFFTLCGNCVDQALKNFHSLQFACPCKNDAWLSYEAGVVKPSWCFSFCCGQ